MQDDSSGRPFPDIDSRGETTMESNQEKVFLITGASTGIGLATALLAAQAGYRVVLASRSKEKLDRFASEIGGRKRALAVGCDVSDWGSVKAMVETALGAYGRIDVAFANAGGVWGGRYVGGEDTPEEWRQMLMTNVFGAAATARLTLPELMTGSVVGRTAPPNNFYSATKWAVTGMAESLRKELVGTGVRVTLVEPGKVDTPFWKVRPEEPMIVGEDIARAVLFAVSQPPHVDVNEVLVRPVGQEL
jgi:NADP-dependent 3-hydroxy acid dehydrogenase YdfG